MYRSSAPRAPAKRIPSLLPTLLIDGLSFLAYRRVATLLHLPATSSRVGVTEIVTVNPSELDAALKRDIQQSGYRE
jgi:hypothetical protein